MQAGRVDSPGERAVEQPPNRSRARIERGELRELSRRHERRRRLAPRAALVGLLAGLIAVLFRALLDLVEVWRVAVIHQLRSDAPWSQALVIFAAMALVTLAVWMVRKLAPEASGSGIPHLRAVLHGLERMRPVRVLIVKFVAGSLGIIGGLTLGREGPTVQMGGAVGDLVARWFPTTRRERQALLCAGAGAGLAAAFNAPLAGLLFVLEELRRDFSPGVLSATFVAAVSGDLVTRLLLGQQPVFHLEAATVPELGSLPWFVLLGALAGLLGVLFSRGLLAGLSLAGRASWQGPLPLLGMGLAIGVTLWYLPEATGGGMRLVEDTLAGRIPLVPLLLFMALRFVLTIGSYSTGAAGGIFAPLLVLGAQLGLGVAYLAHAVPAGRGEDASTLAVVGMAALLAGVVRAPLTGIVLIVEMTERYSLMLPLLAACLTAYGVAELAGQKPIYESLLERLLKTGRGNPRPELEEPVLLDLVVAPGSPFDGQLVKELGLPPGCLLVSVQRGPRTLVPKHDTRLTSGDQVSVMVAPEAQPSMALLRAGVESPPSA